MNAARQVGDGPSVAVRPSVAEMPTWCGCSALLPADRATPLTHAAGDWDRRPPFSQRCPVCVSPQVQSRAEAVVSLQRPRGVHVWCPFLVHGHSEGKGRVYGAVLQGAHWQLACVTGASRAAVVCWACSAFPAGPAWLQQSGYSPAGMAFHAGGWMVPCCRHWHRAQLASCRLCCAG